MYMKVSHEKMHKLFSYFHFLFIFIFICNAPIDLHKVKDGKNKVSLIEYQISISSASRSFHKSITYKMSMLYVPYSSC